MPTKNIGKVSGNVRIDPDTVEEHEDDTDEQLHLWVEELANDKDFINDVAEEIRIWKQKIAEAGCNPEQLVIHMAGESHLDMAYKWRYAQTIKKARRTLAKAMKHARIVPGFTFAVSSPQIMAWMKEHYPEFYADVKEFIKKGNIEPVGGSWVEADCNMPSGEAFVRQRLHGMKLYREEFGKLPEAEWFPDTFGYNAGLPQILAKSGVKYFLTAKMTWCATNDFPLTHFWWASPDGSKVLVTSSRTGTSLFGQFPRYGIYRRLPKPGAKKTWSYDDEFADLIASLDNNAWVKPVALFMGKGDGGHGPTHQEVGSMIAFTKACPREGVNLKWSSVHGYFKDVEQQGPGLLTWKDELYLEYHQGTLTTHPAIKRWNRKLECVLQAAEIAATMAHLSDYRYEYPGDMLGKAWRKVLLNQFHDVLPGSCIPEVLDDLVEIWPEIDQTGMNILDDALPSLATQGDGAGLVHVFNPIAEARTTRLFIPVTAAGKGKKLPAGTAPPAATFDVELDGKSTSHLCQPIAPEPDSLEDPRPAGWWVVLPLPALGVITGRLVIGEPASKPAAAAAIHVEAGTRPCIDNGITRVELDPRTGAIVKLASKGVNGGKNLVTGDDTALTIGYDDDDSEYQAWNVKENYWDFPKNYPQDKNVSITIDSQGPVLASLRVDKTLGISKLSTTIALFKDDPAVHLFWHVDWQEKGVMLKLRVSTATGAVHSISDQMYCAVARKTRPTTSGDKARVENPMQKYVDVSTPGNTWGLTLLNEGKHGYDTRDGKLHLTMQKSALYPDTTSRTWAFMEREERKNRDGTAVPTNVGIGPASCRFALVPHDGGALVTKDGKPTGQAKHLAEAYNHAPIARPAVVKKRASSKAFPAPASAPLSSMAFGAPANVLVSAIKMREWEPTDTVILRVAEIAGAQTRQAIITMPRPFASRFARIEEMDLLERPLETTCGYDKEKGELSIDLAPFEVKTFGLHVKRTKN